MKSTISRKLGALMTTAVVVVGVAVCAASYFAFDRGFGQYALNEILADQAAFRDYVDESSARAEGIAKNAAARDDLTKSAATGDRAAAQAILKSMVADLGVDFATFVDDSGSVFARGHSDRTGDRLDNQPNVTTALAGTASVGIVEGNVIQYSIQAACPVREGNRVIGAVIIGYDLSSPAFVESIKKNHGVEATVFHGDTRVATTLADKDGNSLVGTKMDNQKVLSAVIDGGSDFVGRNVIRGEPFNTVYWPIAGESGKPSGMFFIGKSVASVESTSRSILAVSGTLTVVIAIAVLILSVFSLRGIVRPLKRATAMLRDISEGTGDLTKELAVSGNDEIGELSRYFNRTIGKVRDLVAEIGRQSTVLAGVGDRLSENMTQTAAAVSQISANIDGIRNRAATQTESAANTGKSVEEVKKDIELLDALARDQTDSVAQSSSAIEEMIANVDSVTRTLGHNAESIDTLSAASARGRDDLAAVVSEIQTIARDSEGLVEINEMIENLASQTNLLAMNAAIEAAHAGAAGRGFAVVSDEIRKLAESSSAQAKTVSGVLKGIKASVDRITEASDVVGKQFGEIDGKIRALADQEDAIRRAMEEQGVGGKEILDSVGQLRDISGKVKDGSARMLSETEKAAAESENLDRMAQDISANIDEMASGVRQINESVQTVNAVARSNKDSIDALKDEIGKFKVS